MRRLQTMIVAVLAVTACGGASESSVGTSTAPAGPVPASAEAAEAAVEVTADALIAAMGDEQTALAAVLLAADLGYGADQIVSAGVQGRLRSDGSIVNADGTPLTPDHEPSGILDDDVTGDASEAVGFRSPPTPTRLTVTISELNQRYEDHRGSLIVVLILFAAGYSLEQVVFALLADLPVDDDFRLIDEDGLRILPERVATAAYYEGTSEYNELDDDSEQYGLPALDTADPEPLAEPESERVSGGSIHQATADAPGMDKHNAYCLDYSKKIDGDFRLSLTACTDAPQFEVVHDLGAGTIDGWFDLELACPGLDRCRGEEPVVATVTGVFGPLSYGQQPQNAPEDWPFPADHWYSSGMGHWWAGGPIELAVSISGSSIFWNQTVDESLTVPGWVESTLSPSSQKPGELPTDWMVNFAVDIDYVDTDDPRWDFYVGYFWMFEETAVDIPSWQK